MILGARATEINETGLYPQANNTSVEGERHIKPVNAEGVPAAGGKVHGGCSGDAEAGRDNSARSGVGSGQEVFHKRSVLKLHLRRGVNGMLPGGQGRRNFLSYALISHHGFPPPGGTMNYPSKPQRGGSKIRSDHHSTLFSLLFFDGVWKHVS